MTPTHHPQTAPEERTLPARIRQRDLEPGEPLPNPIFTDQGVLLIARGVVIDERLLETLRGHDDTVLYEAVDLDQLREAGIVGPEPQAHTGAVRTRDALRLITREDADERPLFEFGPLDHDDPAGALRLRAALLKRTDEIVALHKRAWDHARLRITPADASAAPARRSSPVDTDAIHALRRALVDAYRTRFARLAAGLSVPLGSLLSIVDALVDGCRAHPERFANLLDAPGPDPADLPMHALLTSGACVAIASRMGWEGDDVRLAGLAGLVADVGMVMVPRVVRRSTHPLDALGASRVHRHTAHTLALLEPTDLPADVTLACHQHHERLDGSGYPERLRGGAISDFARVLAVADAYVASVSPRPYRPAHRPYTALEEIILLASRDVLDRRAVRSLVEVTGLYPVGGWVRLSTGDAARVVGVGPDRADRPIVRLAESPGAGELDLAEPFNAGIGVVAPIDPPLSVRAGRPG